MAYINIHNFCICRFILHNGWVNKYQTTVETFNNAAEQYWLKFKDFELYQPSYDWFLAHLQADQTELLEIACGPGHVSRYLLQRNSQLQIFGIDLAAKMIELAKQHNPKAEYQVLNCLDIDTLKMSPDAIMCGFCLPYLSWQDCQLLIVKMAAQLVVGGLLYLSTTEGDPSNEGYQGSNSAAGAIYVHYHALEAIEQCLKTAGFEITGRQQLTHIHNNQSTHDVFILARKMA